jgi:protein SCO1/2
MLSFMILTLLFSCKETNSSTERVLPIVGDRDVTYRMVDGKEVADTIYPKVPDFEYLNQDSVIISSKQMKGKIWVADFFFTSCSTICPPMTSQMKRLSILTKDLKKYVQFLSFSIDPDTDTPSQFKRYMKEQGILAPNWYFFTGDEDATYELAHDFFHVGAARNEAATDGFEHTDTFVLVDRDGYVRGLYQGVNTQQVNQLEKDIRKLLKYEYNANIRE